MANFCQQVLKLLGSYTRLLLYSRFHCVLASAFTQLKRLPTLWHFLSSFPQGWQKCDDPSCGYTTRQVPLTHQRGAPRCTTCFRAHLHPVVRPTIKTLCYTIWRSCSSIFSEVSITGQPMILRWLFKTILRKWQAAIRKKGCLTERLWGWNCITERRSLKTRDSRFEVFSNSSVKFRSNPVLTRVL